MRSGECKCLNMKDMMLHKKWLIFELKQAKEGMIKVLVGHISSGKTTYSSQCAREGWVIINDDAIVNAVHGGDYTLYDKQWKPLYKGCEQLS